MEELEPSHSLLNLTAKAKIYNNSEDTPIVSCIDDVDWKTDRLRRWSTAYIICIFCLQDRSEEVEEGKVWIRHLWGDGHGILQRGDHTPTVRTGHPQCLEGQAVVRHELWHKQVQDARLGQSGEDSFGRRKGLSGRISVWSRTTVSNAGAWQIDKFRIILWWKEAVHKRGPAKLRRYAPTKGNQEKKEMKQN